MNEEVILLDANWNEIGTTLKATVHSSKTPLHKAFSCFLFSPDGKLLLQQRSHSKKTWPGVWSNSVCGHPLPGEKMTDAVTRRAQFELGVSPKSIIEMVPNYSYRATMDEVMEHEWCPIWVGTLSDAPKPNADEVAKTQWVNWNNLLQNRMIEWSHLSPWCREEVLLLHHNKAFSDWWKENINQQKV